VKKEIRAINITDIAELEQSIYEVLKYRLSNVINEQYRDILFDDILTIIDENKKAIKKSK
tara:strand:+ start:421 stop:600 length:180 start_codon:yes stop_codon:yes gene_type:complete